ncbi:MAG: TonB-dependent receptor, partial [Bacteroidota bacterium]
MMRFVFLSIFLLSFLRNQGLAQNPDELRLDTVAIASSRVNQSEWQTGRNITLLTARDISQLPVASIDEAL